ncbi:MAG TPA: phosphotransferase [Candidatus Limnocylindrales bacterium]|nr:phosphotransferase [Candidatus Limnocylindrales bacterium]
MRHGYSNDTRSDGAVVLKRYQGPDRATRRQREYAALQRLRGRLPVPPLWGGDEVSVCLGFISGVHGQDLIEAGQAPAVLRACGQMLNRIHEVDPAQVFPGTTLHSGQVLVHGDYGPNNLLLDPDTFAVTAVLDWEWAEPGNPVRDLAWCEWIVRMHHREHIDALDEFFDAYGHRPAWPLRHQAMLVQCRSLLEMCRHWTTEAASLWQRRLDMTAAWTE